MAGNTSYWQGTGSTTSGTSTCGNIYTDSSSSTTYVFLRPRRILVSSPAHWKKEDSLAFVDLVNNKTKTGWLVTMLIDGDILITDPDIETRTMEAFVPLLKKRASSDDMKTINEFFAEHTIGES